MNLASAAQKPVSLVPGYPVRQAEKPCLRAFSGFLSKGFSFDSAL